LKSDIFIIFPFFSLSHKRTKQKQSVIKEEFSLFRIFIPIKAGLYGKNFWLDHLPKFQGIKMTLLQLKYAVMLDRFKSFALTSAELMITQPTLSMQIQKLERHLGFELFDRSQTPILTTVSGKEFINQAKRVLEEFEKLEYTFRNRTDEIDGDLKIGIIPTVASYLLEKILPVLIKKYPNLQIRIYETVTEQILRKLETGDLDIGILATPLKNKKIQEIPVFYEPFFLYVSPSFSISDNPIDLDRLKDSPILILGEEHCFREQTLKICSSSQTRIETGSFATIKKLVDNDLGISLLPEFEEVAHPQRKRQIGNPIPAREISLVINPSFYKTAHLKAVQKEILSLIPSKYHKKGNLHIIGVID
jgi:LysR family transcriptional regulator, hydrogen peroxide-inducible genes activator